MSTPLEPDEVERAIRNLSRTSAPEDLWPTVACALAEGSNAKKPSVFRRPVRSPMLAVAAGFLALLLGAYVGMYRLYRAPSQWSVSTVSGMPSLAGEQLLSTGRLATGQWLATDSVSAAKLEVGNIGEVVLGPDSRVRLDRGGALEHRLTLERGFIDAVITAPPRLFFVQTPTALATDLGCAYTLRVNGDGTTLIEVTAGWVELEQDGRVSLVPAGLIAEVEAGAGPGTPHPSWLSDTARSSLQRLDRGIGSSADLDRVLAELETSATAVTLRKERGITIWHLLQRVDPVLRERAYRQLQLLSPAPSDVTREGILALERPMLERWRRDLNPLWSEEAQPFFVRLARHLWDWTVK